MKFQNIIRNGLIFAGVAAALSFPCSVKAQEISNTPFNDGPNVAPLAEPTVTAPSANVYNSTLPSDQAARAAVAINTAFNASDAAQSANDNQERPTTKMWAGVLLVWVGVLGVYAYAPVKRHFDTLRSLRNSSISTRGV